LSTIYKIPLCAVIAVLLNYLSIQLESPYLTNFLHDKIVELLITLLAINTATTSLIVAKIEDLRKKFGDRFPATSKEAKQSLYEQIILIGLSVTSLFLLNSKVILAKLPHATIVIDTLLIAIFLYSLEILRISA
jgi:hypothetical protein